jgi:anti-sigma regulatory factor (Ser/Thr protein kinase)
MRVPASRESHAPEHNGTLRLRVPADADALPRVRASARAWLADVGVDAPTAYELVLAVSEACANAVEHPIARRSASMQVDGAVQAGELVVSVRDDGVWRSPAAPGDRGRGLPIIRALVDDVEVVSSADGTELRLRRRVG